MRWMKLKVEVRFGRSATRRDDSDNLVGRLKRRRGEVQDWLRVERDWTRLKAR